MGDDHHRIQERANRLGKSSASDPRLLFLFEFFREFYVRRQELLKKIFPRLQNEFIDIFRRVGRVLGEGKSNNDTTAVRTLQRSLSLGSPRTPSNKGGESPLRLERFKIRTVKLGDDDVQQGGQGQTKPFGSK
ncbi:hypothetical protein CCACVL1_00579 [Corchorus capsularis]|uniref:Uncharacterized protein n=1 Tax=Corchorus capsularis TaxID=210143 RepID=A0A1R3KW28_COCAP|nr:hypothetical protein CCACVL1_00579 [Corchorus capsularis]